MCRSTAARCDFYAVPALAGVEKMGPSVRRLLDEEKAVGLDHLDYYADYRARRVETLKASLRGLLTDLKQSGKKIAAYGASAKGSTLLNYCGIGAETLDFVVDRSTVKQGRYTPGVHLPIYAPEKLLGSATGLCVLLLTWNFFARDPWHSRPSTAAEAASSSIPLPEPRVVGEAGVEDLQEKPCGSSEQKLAGVYLIEPVLLEDDRGFFARTFSSLGEFVAQGLNANLVQCKAFRIQSTHRNLTRNALPAGSVRGGKTGPLHARCDLRRGPGLKARLLNVQTVVRRPRSDGR